MTTDKVNIICGKHAVRHCLQSAPESVVEIWVQEGKRDSKAIREILEQAGAVNVQTVSREDLDRLTQFARHQGIALKCKHVRTAEPDLESLLAVADTRKLLLLVLDGIQDPHNLGACLRTADAAGVDAVIIPRDRAATITPAVRKVASGGAESVPIIRVTNLSRSLRQIQGAGIWTLGTAGSAADSLYALDLDRPLAVVLGAEGTGLRHNTLEQCDMLVRIPMAGAVESLNVSVAAGVVLYEAVRQRQAHA